MHGVLYAKHRKAIKTLFCNHENTLRDRKSEEKESTKYSGNYHSTEMRIFI